MIGGKGWSRGVGMKEGIMGGSRRRETLALNVHTLPLVKFATDLSQWRGRLSEFVGKHKCYRVGLSGFELT